MKTRDWGWNSRDNLEMYARCWEPDEQPKAIVYLVHGLGEHSGRYAHVGNILAQAGFALVGFDLRGHGKSGGQRGHFPSLDILMDDMRQIVQQKSEENPGVPSFLYGHSLGGLLILNYATYQKHSLSGVIATGAGLRSPVLEQKAKIGLSKILGGLLPTVSINTGLNANDISCNAEVVRAYKQDLLVHDLATLSAARVGVDAVERAFAQALKFSAPLLLMHGSEDRVTYPHGSQEFADLIPGECTLKFWEGLCHEIHNEPEQGEVFAFMIDWLNAQLSKK